ncbi:MAG: hypothetical protein WKF84_26375 [Pyrinomonadaceae bacterium]
MAEINNIGSRSSSSAGTTPPENNQPRNLQPGQAKTINASLATPGVPVGPPRSLGQPTGLLAPVQTTILTDVLAGREVSQMRAAEQMREAGGAPATDRLLSLDVQPSFAGAFPPPPGNIEALRHLSPAMRRSMLTSLIVRQRLRLKRLGRPLHDAEEDEQRDDREETSHHPGDSSSITLSAAERERAASELKSVARMLDLLDEMILMQEYTLSQMGSFSQG